MRHVVPHGDRSNVVIEPFLTDQWYVNAKELAKPAIAAVREGKTNFVPKNWENDLFQLDGEHPALVHLAPALVGPSNSGVVWAVTARISIFVAMETAHKIVSVSGSSTLYEKRRSIHGGRRGCAPT